MALLPPEVVSDTLATCRALSALAPVAPVYSRRRAACGVPVEDRG